MAAAAESVDAPQGGGAEAEMVEAMVVMREVVQAAGAVKGVGLKAAVVAATVADCLAVEVRAEVAMKAASAPPPP